MALTDKLSAIGDAIRAKTGETGLLRLDEMPTAIAAIQTGGGGDDLFVDYLNNTLTEFRVPDGITMLHNRALAYAENLETVDLNDVTTIETEAFYYCEKLKNIDLSNVTTVESNAFQYTGVTEIDLSSLTRFDIRGYSFNYCHQLETVSNINIPTEIPSRTFANCPKMKSIDLHNIKTIKSNGLNGVKSLEEVNLPNIERIEYDAFSCTQSYKNNVGHKVDIGPNCKSIGYDAFEYWTAIDTLIVRATTPPDLAMNSAFQHSFGIGLTGYATQEQYDAAIGRYIYVPRDSIAAYKTATNWSAYSVSGGMIWRAIEDYPEICG